MIDRKARDEAAEVLRQFFAGRVTNFEFEDRFPSSGDPALWAIEDTVWCFYDDFDTHTMEGEWRLTDEWKKIVSRWTIFLHSDEEYIWPKISYPGIRPLGSIFFRKAENRFMGSGEYEYWPFQSEASFNLANSNPKLLSRGSE